MDLLFFGRDWLQKNRERKNMLTDATACKQTPNCSKNKYKWKMQIHMAGILHTNKLSNWDILHRVEPCSYLCLERKNYIAGSIVITALLATYFYWQKINFATCKVFFHWIKIAYKLTCPIKFMYCKFTSLTTLSPPLQNFWSFDPLHLQLFQFPPWLEYSAAWHMLRTEKLYLLHLDLEKIKIQNMQLLLAQVTALNFTELKPQSTKLQ